MNRESWFWIGMVILAILILGTLSVLVGSDADGNIDPGSTPTAPQLETPLDVQPTPEIQPSDVSAGS